MVSSGCLPGQEVAGVKSLLKLSLLSAELGVTSQNSWILSWSEPYFVPPHLR